MYYVEWYWGCTQTTQFVVHIDNIAQIINDIEGLVMMEDEKSYLYTLKIVMAENLVALDSNGLSDMYCVISDEGR